MAEGCSSWWRNCAREADSTILDMNGMKHDAGPIETATACSRRLKEDRAWPYPMSF